MNAFISDTRSIDNDRKRQTGRKYTDRQKSTQWHCTKIQVHTS